MDVFTHSTSYASSDRAAVSNGKEMYRVKRLALLREKRVTTRAEE